MKIKVYQATDGDCLLVESTGSGSAENQSAMLVDGGRKGSYRKFTAPDLEGRALELVVVSHIDNDHISGVVELFDQTVEWTVFRHHEKRLAEELDQLSAEEIERRERELARLRPSESEPPSVEEVWHNAFSDQVGFESEVPLAQSVIDGALVSLMRMQLLDRRFEDDLEHTANMAQGVKDAVILRNRLSEEQLDLPVNSPSTPHELMFLGDETGDGSVPAEVLDVGAFEVRVLGPSRDDLVRLEEEWRKWLAANEAVAEELRREAQRESERLDAGQAVVLRSVLAQLAKRLGDGSTITPPNLASLLLLVEQGDRRLLLTGDGNASEVLRGLRAHGLLAPDTTDTSADPGSDHATASVDDAPETVHVDVFKVPHHGALDNIDADGFFSLVTGDHYVFCGNGSHHNPELAVVERIVEARSARVDDLGPFELWFSSSSAAANTESRRKHMKEVEELLQGHDQAAHFTAHFLGKDVAFFEIE